MKYFDTHIFVIIHFAPLFISEWPNFMSQSFREYGRRHNASIVNLLKIIAADKTNHWKENKTTRSTVMKKTSLSKSELIKMIMWFYLCELSSLVKIFCEESESGPALRRLTDDEWAWRSPVKNISDWVIREIASGGEARAPSPVPMEPEWH